MDGLALRTEAEVSGKAGSPCSPSPPKWNSTAIWWLLHDSWKMLWLPQVSIWRTGTHSAEVCNTADPSKVAKD